MSDITKTNIAATAKVDPAKEAEKQKAPETSPAVVNVLASIGRLTLEQRKEFAKKFTAAFNEEIDLHSGGKKMDVKRYVA